MIVSSEDDSPVCNKMTVDEITDMIHVMQLQESTHYKCKHYMGASLAVDRDCRMKMVEWCYQVTDFCKFKRQTVAVSMSYLDRFLSTSCSSALQARQFKRDYQLAAMTCLYIAIKLFEPMVMDTSLLSSISQGCYSESEISDMEKEILTSLGWRMNGPTSHDFLSHILEVLPPTANKSCKSIYRTLLDFSKFQVELAVSDYDLSVQKPSLVALAAILNSAEGVDDNMFTAQCRHKYIKYICNELGMDPFSKPVNAARFRLLKLFSMSSGYEMPQIANFNPIACPDIGLHHACSSQKARAHESPISVAINMYDDKPTVRNARCA
jgi:hypothetical protein